MSINRNGGGRIYWLDISRCLLIYLVVLAHFPSNDTTFTFIRKFIFSFHMPAFLFLSGITNKSKDIFEDIKKNARNILVPYIFFYIITWLWWFLIFAIRNPLVYPRNYKGLIEPAIIKPFLGMLIANGFDSKISTMLTTPLWFLPVLFWCKLLYSVISKKVKTKREILIQATACTVFLLIAYILQYLRSPEIIDTGKYSYAVKWLPFSLGSLFLSYPFFYAGTFLKHRLFKSNLHFKGLYFFYCILSLALIIVVTKTTQQKVDLNYVIYGDDIFLLGLTSTAGIFLSISLGLLLPKSRFLLFIGRNTITILALHRITNSLVYFIPNKLGIKLIESEEYLLNTGCAIVLAFFSLLLCCVPAYIIEKYFPFILGRSNKSNIEI